MATRRRPADVGAEIGRKALADLLREEAIARRDRGLSLLDVGAAVGVSESWLSRTERGLAGDVGLVRLSEMLSVVGLTLSARAYPGGSPLRDEGHAGLLLRLRRELHPTLFWRVEVPFPLPGDLRAWDAMVGARTWRYGVEAEMRPTDAQALARRLQLKVRDGGVDGVLLVLPATAHTRAFLNAAGELLAPMFPVGGRRALELLRAGVDPGGNAIIVL